MWRELKRNYYSKKRREYRFQKDSKTDKYITETEELININPSPYQCNKQKIIVY